jgi:hypothetical protein
VTTFKTFIARKLLLGTLCAAIMPSLIGFDATQAAAPQRLWSIAVHIEYQDGTVYENAFATGITTEDMPTILAECGKSHWTGSVVRYHCFPIPE